MKKTKKAGRASETKKILRQLYNYNKTSKTSNDLDNKKVK